MSQRVVLKIYDILGRHVATVVNENKAPGNYEINFDATQLPTGVYFYKISAGKFSKVKKMLLIR